MYRFLKLLMAILLMLTGLYIMASIFLGNYFGPLFGNHMSAVVFWGFMVFGAVVFLGGIYMLKRR